jgi:hypothetical protein
VEFTRRKKDRGALRIPAADGYHYADDHPWDGEDQVALITALDAIEQEFKRLEPKGFMPHKRQQHRTLSASGTKPSRAVPWVLGTTALM